MSAPLIIGIHGLANKPPKSELSNWWETAIREGLAKNESVTDPEFDFEMVYWADKMYKNPLHRDEEFDFDDLFNNEPYIEAEDGELRAKMDGYLDAIAAKVFDLAGESLDGLKSHAGMDGLADKFIGMLLKDLNHYYQNEAKRKALRDTLLQTLLENKGRKIMLVAHSMGSIISYDCLTLLGQTHPGHEIDYFVTIGSPLGLPHVRNKIIEEFVHRGDVKDRVRTPTVVKKRWLNFADRKDPVAFDVHLADDYGENKHGVKCADDLVYNDYKILKKGSKYHDRNYHKSYGYLRTPELSKLVTSFL